MDEQVQREGVKKSYARMFTAPDFSNLILSDDAFDALSSEDEYGEDEDSEYPKQPDFGDDIIRASFRTNQKADASSSANRSSSRRRALCTNNSRTICECSIIGFRTSCRTTPWLRSWT